MLTLCSTSILHTGGVVVFTILSLLFLYYRRRGKGGSVLTNWPVVGMLPGLVSNCARIHEFATEILEQNGGTFLFKGPVFTNMDMLLTCSPANINYILTKNFSNFSKGPEFKKIFNFLGDGIFIAESESWEMQRRVAKTVMGHTRFPEFVAETTWRKMETGLIPILKHVSDMGTEVDLQQLFQRFTFDLSCILVLGHDPVSLSKELPHSRYMKAFEDVEEAALYRHLLPEAVWKMQKWLHIGREQKLSQAIETLDGFLSYCISLKQGRMNTSATRGNEDLDMLASCMKALAVAEKGDTTNAASENVLKDLMLNLIFAGKDTISATLSWFFWLLGTNPAEEERIRNEITTNSQEPGKWKFTNMDVLNKLVYLHGALCESLRLFPPVAIQHKAPLKHDVLPSGHDIKPNTRTLPVFYSMGRMELIWGKDCRQFKPGRWISEQGRVKVEPSYKFTAFNAGPRSCLGKEMSFIQAKIAAAAMISRFRIEVADGHTIQPSASVILHMKHGLMVKVSKSV